MSRAEKTRSTSIAQRLNRHFRLQQLGGILVADLSRLIGQVQKSGVQVNSSATEIAATSKQQQATVTEIAATTAEVG
ncbi:MAG: methyl-accepting chemotaxis protein, partial [bacterium]|nr:methyl-accepting chemotaxis protein [bacterium]